MSRWLALFIIAAAALALHGLKVARMTADGNWGVALGLLLVGPLAYAAVSALAGGMRRLLGRAALVELTPRANGFASVLGPLAVLGPAFAPPP